MPPQILAGADVASQAYELFVAQLGQAVAARGRFLVNLSGGSTPLELYARLATRTQLDWGHTWVTWGDERFVPPDHPLSNAGAARAALLDRVAIPPEQILLWPWSPNESAARVARAYQELLISTFGREPVFDLTLLGLGADGHTASLFPGTGAVRAAGLTTTVRPSGVPNERLTMTPSALSSSRVVAFLVRGENKRGALEATLAASGDPDSYPARSIGAKERLLWITDLSDLRLPSAW